MEVSSSVLRQRYLSGVLSFDRTGPPHPLVKLRLLGELGQDIAQSVHVMPTSA
jgi:hypothetical protein